MEKAVIFGAGETGRQSLVKLQYVYDVVAFSDNNSALWGESISGIPVLEPKRLSDMYALVFICVDLHWREIAIQLSALNVKYVVLETYLSYRLENHRMLPLHLAKHSPYKKTNTDEFAVLFVQQKFCSRTDKEAYALNQIGVKTYAAFQVAPSKMERAFYEQIPIFSYAALMEYVNESEFDIVHCSNEDDTLTNLLIHSNKKVVFDCHDIISESYTYIRYEKFLLEYIANTKSDGIMIPSEEAKKLLCKKYDLKKDKILVLGNYPLTSFKPTIKMRKLSEIDGEIHCVYEGGIIFNADTFVSKYYFYDHFLKFCEAGIHIHFYSNANETKCEELAAAHPLMHYEGNRSGIDLITQMQKYDIGFCLYNIAEGTMDSYLKICSPNKFFEYLAAGLPVITNVDALAKFAIENKCGEYFDFNGDIQAQCKEVLQIKINENFLETKGLTMNAHAQRILDFYKSIILRKERMTI